MENKRFGYARVSTNSQSLETQKEALIKYGLNENEIYVEKSSGRNDEREILNNIFLQLRSGDTLVVEQLSRFGRSLTFVYKKYYLWLKTRLTLCL